MCLQCAAQFENQERQRERERETERQRQRETRDPLTPGVFTSKSLVEVVMSRSAGPVALLLLTVALHL